MQKFLAGPRRWFIRSNSPYWANGNGHTHQSNRLHHVVRRIAERAAVIDLSGRMCVRDLDEAGQQDKRDAHDPEQTDPGPLKTLFVHESTHVCLNIMQNRLNRKTAWVEIQLIRLTF